MTRQAGNSRARNSNGANRLCWQQFIIFSQQHAEFPFGLLRRKKSESCVCFLPTTKAGFLLPIQIRIYCICLQKSSSLEVAAGCFLLYHLLSKLPPIFCCSFSLIKKIIRSFCAKGIKDHFSKWNRGLSKSFLSFHLSLIYWVGIPHRSIIVINRFLNCLKHTRKCRRRDKSNWLVLLFDFFSNLPKGPLKHNLYHQKVSCLCKPRSVYWLVRDNKVDNVLQDLDNCWLSLHNWIVRN